MKAKCSYCGTEINRSPSLVNNARLHFCDRKCKDEWQKENLNGIKNPNYKFEYNKICLRCGKLFKNYIKSVKYCSRLCAEGAIYKICLFCGKEYKINKARANTSKFCSLNCAYKHDTAIKCKIINKKCEICDNIMVLSYSNRNKRFCSVKCYAIYREDYLKGSNNPRWLGGLSKSNFRGENWKEIKHKICEMQVYSCQLCGAQPDLLGGRKVSVHHIIPWRISHNNNIYNLICLCDKCHPSEDMEYNRLGKPSLKLRRRMLEIFPELQFEELYKGIETPKKKYNDGEYYSETREHALSKNFPVTWTKVIDSLKELSSEDVTS